MWIYEGKPFEIDESIKSVGFVYLIYNRTTEKYYIGKKLFTKQKRFQRNKKIKRTRVESDWLTYTGSNKALNEDVEQGHELEKTILYLCSSRGWMSYYETLEILKRDAIIRDDYYNEWCTLKLHAKHLK